MKTPSERKKNELKATNDAFLSNIYYVYIYLNSLLPKSNAFIEGEGSNREPGKTIVKKKERDRKKRNNKSNQTQTPHSLNAC